MTTVLCRPAVQSDAQAIDAAAYASAVQHYSDNPHLFAPPKAAPGAWSTDLLQEHHDARVFVAEHLGEVVGFVHVTINLETRALFNQAKYGKIESVAVLPRQRGKGFGTALLQHAEAWAREHGCPEVRLNVWLFNERAANLYHRLGFTPMSMFMAKHLE